LLGSSPALEIDKKEERKPGKTPPDKKAERSKDSRPQFLLQFATRHHLIHPTIMYPNAAVAARHPVS
jgi:hypothetical protein